MKDYITIDQYQTKRRMPLQTYYIQPSCRVYWRYKLCNMQNSAVTVGLPLQLMRMSLSAITTMVWTHSSVVTTMLWCVIITSHNDVLVLIERLRTKDHTRRWEENGKHWMWKPSTRTTIHDCGECVHWNTTTRSTNPTHWLCVWGMLQGIGQPPILRTVDMNTQ